MAITTYLDDIKNSIYGKDVRVSIVNAIQECYDNAAINHDNANMEVALARGTFTTLNNRLNNTDADLVNKADILYVEGEIGNVEEEIQVLDGKISSIASGSPKGAFATLTDLQTNTTANTTDGKKYIYVVQADGKWYYWNGSAWTAGGTYQSTVLADGSITGKKLVNANGTRSSANLFNKDKVTSGAIDNGAIIAIATYYASDYIEVVGNSQYTISYAEQIVGSFYDVNKAYISEINIATISTPYTFSVPANACYFRYNVKDSRLATMMMVKGTTIPETYVPYTEKYNYAWLNVKEENYDNNSIPYSALNTNTKQILLSKWNNKKWLIWGDSITEHNMRTNKNYQDYIAEKINCTVYNHGIGGTGYFNRYDVSALTENPDLITIWLGSNDWGNNTQDNQKPLGSFGDTTNATIAGCVYLTLQNMVNKYPTVPIGVFTPLQRRNNYGSNATPNSRGFTLKQTSDVIVETCRHFGIAVLNLYDTCSFNVWNDAANAYYFTAPGLTEPDGLHLNDFGHQNLADRGLNFINSL